MIYLIGGAPRIGKSIIAKRLAKTIGARFVSTDEIEDRLGRKTDNPMPPFSCDPKKNTLAPGQRAKMLVSEAEILRHKLDEVIEMSVNAGKDTVIEGVHLLPAYAAGKITEFGRKNIRAIFIGCTDSRLIRKGMVENSGPNNWPKDCGREVLGQIAAFSKKVSEYIAKETNKYSLSYWERSKDFQKDTAGIIEKLSQE